MKFYDFRKNLKAILVLTVTLLCGIAVGFRPWANRSSFAATSREVAIVGCVQNGTTIDFKAFSGIAHVSTPTAPVTGGCGEALGQLLTLGFTLQSANGNTTNANIQYLLIR